MITPSLSVTPVKDFVSVPSITNSEVTTVIPLTAVLSTFLLTDIVILFAYSNLIFSGNSTEMFSADLTVPSSFFTSALCLICVFSIAPTTFFTITIYPSTSP